MRRLGSAIFIALIFIAGIVSPGHTALAHGSVASDKDSCLIQIGYYKAHFKIYLPEKRQHEQFCEDLPAVGESIFVMEYVHRGLGNVPIDFRIIRNVTGQGRFARLSDVEKIGDLDAVTVFHQPAQVQPDVFTVKHVFDEPGKFIGIITLTIPDSAKTYTAVFPFDVGFTGFGYWPWFALAAVVLQVNYLWMSGRLSRRRGKRPPRLTVIPGKAHG